MYEINYNQAKKQIEDAVFVIDERRSAFKSKKIEARISVAHGVSFTVFDCGKVDGFPGPALQQAIEHYNSISLGWGN